MKKIYFLVVVFCSFIGGYGQIINFPDADFKTKLLLSSSNNYIAIDINLAGFKIDANDNGEIEVSEALQVRRLRLSNSGISNLEGIINFSNLEVLEADRNDLPTINVSGLTHLKELYIGYNPLSILSAVNFIGTTSLEKLSSGESSISVLDVSTLVSLKDISCINNNQLTTLNINGLINLERLDCSFNSQLHNLDASSLTNLIFLSCHNNQLTSLNIASSTKISTLNCDNNQLTSLNISGLTSLRYLYCAINQLTSLDFNSNFRLTIRCSSNKFETLDLSKVIMIESFDCSNNPFLKSIILKNGNFEINSYLNFSNNLNLNYICQDENPYQIWHTENLIYQYGYTNCTVNSYCTFAPGGNYYLIQGYSKYDVDNNGCDNLDLIFPNLKFSISSGTNSGDFIVNASGVYSIPVQDATHTIIPVLENPTYFNISPSTVNITFPTQASPLTQNFCVTANGIHPDLEISLLTINAARPGFDATYKIIYKNKGNTTQSGTVNLAFNDAVLDFVSAIPATASQSVNNLSWNFTNLAPFETREIALTLNVNSPMETPAVNGGDILNYTTTISSSAIDDLPNDNTFVFNQTVVNSFDPNDKTCLQGATIAPEKVGDYVHYMIRFENTGTFPAENIVVKDMIDTAKFDVNSLIPVKGSHSFVTIISDGNKVEFIFENINLPFDDANNDGYVAFKIKTKPTLVNGNTFSNTASIYFDYNFPIVTNTATTTIAALSI